MLCLAFMLIIRNFDFYLTGLAYFGHKQQNRWNVALNSTCLCSFSDGICFRNRMQGSHFVCCQRLGRKMRCYAGSISTVLVDTYHLSFFRFVRIACASTTKVDCILK